MKVESYQITKLSKAFQKIKLRAHTIEVLILSRKCNRLRTWAEKDHLIELYTRKVISYGFRYFCAHSRVNVFLHVLRTFKPALNLYIKYECRDDTLDDDAIIVYGYGTQEKKKNALRVSAQTQRGLKENLKRDQKGSEMTTYVIFINYL